MAVLVVYLHSHKDLLIGCCPNVSFLVSQARAQSATELSTSRRLKAELSRAFAFQQRQQAKGTAAAAGIVLSSRTAPLGQRGGGGDIGAGIGIGFDGQGLGAEAVGAMLQGLPQEEASGAASTGSVIRLGLVLKCYRLPVPFKFSKVTGGCLSPRDRNTYKIKQQQQEATTTTIN